MERSDEENGYSFAPSPQNLRNTYLASSTSSFQSYPGSLKFSQTNGTKNI